MYYCTYVSCDCSLVFVFVFFFYIIFVFFFKQTTAYEMRISDWSSDVCSSDLADRARQRRAVPQRHAARRPAPAAARLVARGAATGHPPSRRSEEHTSELQSLMRRS